MFHLRKNKDASISKTVPNLPSSFKKLVLLSIVLGSISLVILALYADPESYKNFNFHEIQRFTSEHQLLTDLDKLNKKFLNSASFFFSMNVFYSDDMIKKMGKSLKALKPCKPAPLLISNKTHIWVRRDTSPKHNSSKSMQIICCYRSFYRPQLVDNISSLQIDDRVKYSNCTFFSNSIRVKDEFVRVNCKSEEKLISNSFFLFPREKKIPDEPKNDLKYNVLILGIDGVSRLNLHRTMPKTVTLLAQLEAVELLRYNKVGDNTFPNLIPLLLGIKETELQKTCWPDSKSVFDNCPFIWKAYQRAGFATAFAEDSATLGMFRYNKKRGFAESPTDYYPRTFMSEAESKAGSNKDKNSLLCMNEKYFFKILLEYVEDLTTILKHKLCGFFWEITMSHDHLNYPAAMDNDYKMLIKNMQNSGYLNKTIIFLMSDHGKRWGKFRKTVQGFLEDRLPFVFALMPPSFREDYSEAYRNLKQNVGRLATPYDMHATLSDLINLDSINNSKIISRTNSLYYVERGISLFLPIPRERTCESAAIDAHWCVDYRSVVVHANSSTVTEAIKHVVAHINDLLRQYLQCAELTLAKALLVKQLSLNGAKEGNNGSTMLTVSFEAMPGGGVFEATLVRQGRAETPWIILGAVSRINSYDDQSYCVSSDKLKLYCFCTNTTVTTKTYFLLR